MNNRFAAAVLAIGLLVWAPAARAQAGFGVAGGPSFPMGDLKNLVNPGFHGGVVLELGIPLLPIGLRADGMFQQLPGAAGGQNFRQVAGTVNGRLGVLPIPFISAYVTAGAGIYASDFAGGQATAGTSWNSDVGINGGIGGRLNLLVIRPFIEARYHHVMTSPSRAFVPVTVGVFF
jgi:hypothetical protein